MTVTDQIKILDDKIKSNQAQYDLGREAAKISALSSKDLFEKYQYLTGEDLGQKTKFEYSWVCHFVKYLKKIRLKVLLRARVISSMTTTIYFTNFAKGMINLKTCHQILSTVG